MDRAVIGPGGAAEVRLPRLRADLAIMDAAAGGSAVLHDPLQHRYFRLDPPGLALLRAWREGMTLGEWGRAAGTGGRSSEVDETHCRSVLDLAIRSDWCVIDGEAAARSLIARAAARRHTFLVWLFHTYLYVKIPLFKPQALLERTLPLVAPLYSLRAAIVVAICGVVGVYLAARQFDVFLATLSRSLTLEQAPLLIATIAFVKLLHEAGHAFTAVRYGCRVPSMGVVLMVMAPVLYTDVTDAWRLPSARQRFLIHAAGIVVELSIACLATLAWVFLPDGGMRHVAFMLATTSWVMTLAVNLNPFMRFDGYFLLSEAIGEENLQPRAFALARWHLRRLLFAPGLAPPEVLPGRRAAYLIAYAWATWCYRLVVFTGLALLVYGYFFKALGIVLFLAEIWFFIARPIIGEIMAWRSLDPASLSRARVAATMACSAAAVAALFVPWSTRVEVPAVLEARDVSRIYPTRAGRVAAVEVQPGEYVEAGRVIARLEVPELDAEIETTRVRLELVDLRRARAASTPEDRAETLVLQHERDMLEAKLGGLERQRGELVVRAPREGRVLEVARHLHIGRSVGKDEMLALVAQDTTFVVRGYLSGSDVARVEPGTGGRFVPEDLTRGSLPVRLATIGKAGVTSVDILPLASSHGGRVEVSTDETRSLVPSQAHYLVEMSAHDAGGAPVVQTVRGLVVLDGVAESLAGRIARRVASVVIRESGF